MSLIPSAPRAFAALSVAAALLLLAACGGGGDADKDDPQTHAEYVKAASAACTAAAKESGKVDVPVDLEGLATYARAVEGIGQQLTDRLGDLRPPQEDAKKHERLHSATEEATHAAGQLADAAARKDRTAISSLSDQLAKANVGVYAAQAGVPECSTAVGLPGD